MRYGYRNHNGLVLQMEEQEHRVLRGCSKVVKDAFGYFDSTTNSDIKKAGKVAMPSADVGLVMAQLRARHFIDYEHIETGRMARGSGRYTLELKFNFVGEEKEDE